MVEKESRLFDNKALASLILTCGAVPGSAGRNGGLDHGCKCRRSSGVRCFAGR